MSMNWLTGLAGCCCSSCAVLSQGANRTNLSAYTQVAGTWTLNGFNLITTSDTSAIIVANAQAADPTLLRLRCTIGATPANSILRVIVGYLDSSNYLYCQVETVAAGAGSLKLFRCVAGVHTQLGATKTLANFGGDVFWMEACVAHGDLHGGVEYTDSSGIQRQMTQRATATAPGTQAGFGTGATMAGPVDIIDFLFHNHKSDGNDCPSCVQNCTECTGSRGPAAWKIEVTGVGTGGCGTCNFNATYIFPTHLQPACSLSTFILYFPGDWIRCGGCFVGLNQYTQVNMHLLLDLQNASDEIELEIFGSGIGAYYTLARTYPLDCLNIVDLILPYDAAKSSYPAGPPPFPFADMGEEINWSGATIKLTALP